MCLVRSLYCICAPLREYGAIQHLLAYLTIYWGNVYAGCGGTCLSLDHGLGQYACNNSSIILIVVKWSTKHSIHQKVKE